MKVRNFRGAHVKLSLKKKCVSQCISILFVCVFPGWFLSWRTVGPPVNLSRSCCKEFWGDWDWSTSENLSRNNGKANHATRTSTPQNSWFREFIRNQTRKKCCLSLKCCWLPFWWTAEVGCWDNPQESQDSMRLRDLKDVTRLLITTSGIDMSVQSCNHSDFSDVLRLMTTVLPSL